MAGFTTLEAQAHAWLREHVDRFDDDAVPLQNVTCTSVDAHVEGVHFFANPARHDWRWIARRAVLASTSDIWAQGAIPSSVLISVTWPVSSHADELLHVLDCFREACKDLSVDWLGGNITTGPTSQFHITSFGTHEGPDRQRVASVGMRAYVATTIGDAVIGRIAFQTIKNLNQSESSNNRFCWPSEYRDLYRSIGQLKTNCGLTDITDGLATELNTIARRSGVCAILDVDKIPRSARFNEYTNIADNDFTIRDELLYGSDEYCPLVCLFDEDAATLARDIEKRGHTLYAVGRFVHGTGLEISGTIPSWYDNS